MYQTFLSGLVQVPIYTPQNKELSERSVGTPVINLMNASLVQTVVGARLFIRLWLKANPRGEGIVSGQWMSLHTQSIFQADAMLVEEGLPTFPISFVLSEKQLSSTLYPLVRLCSLNWLMGGHPIALLFPTDRLVRQSLAGKTKHSELWWHVEVKEILKASLKRQM